MSIPDLIKYWGYPVETHEVRTDDGYLLTVHRIPHGKRNSHSDRNNNDTRRPIIFLQHGLLASSAYWVTNLPHQSLGYMLSDAGFDVWMGNMRGNTYSRKHTFLNVSSSEFWDFCFDDMAKYDLPAMIDYVLKATNRSQLYYVGHSQGTLTAFAGLSENKEMQKKMKMVFAMAPVARLRYIKNSIKNLANFEDEFSWILKLLKINVIFPHWEAYNIFIKTICPWAEYVCDSLPRLMGGWNNKYLNLTRVPVYFTYFPAGTSAKNMYHYAQLVKSGNFQKFDYGWWGNIVEYGSFHAPMYHLENVPNAIVLFSGAEDTTATPKDVQWIAEHLPNVIRNIVIKGFNHLAIGRGVTANKEVNEKIINFVREDWT